MLFLLSAIVDEPVGNTNVGDLCVSKFLEMCEQQLSFFLLGCFASGVKIVFGMGHGHYQFRLNGKIAHL